MLRATLDLALWEQLLRPLVNRHGVEMSFPYREDISSREVYAALFDSLEDRYEG
jgi:hypothetical protein